MSGCTIRMRPARSRSMRPMPRCPWCGRVPTSSASTPRATPPSRCATARLRSLPVPARPSICEAVRPLELRRRRRRRGPLGPPDDFERWCDQRAQRWARNQYAAQYVSSDVVGSRTWTITGDWRQEPDYGYVWYPTRSRPAGLPIAMGDGPGWDPGAGPGWITRPGASRRFTMAAGLICGLVGAGCRAAAPPCGVCAGTRSMDWRSGGRRRGHGRCRSGGGRLRSPPVRSTYPALASARATCSTSTSPTRLSSTTPTSPTSTRIRNCRAVTPTATRLAR